MAMKTLVREIGGKWYAFDADSKTNTVYSIGTDCPPRSTGANRYFAKWNDEGIQYVATPRPTWRAAYQFARRWGVYYGRG